MRIGVAYFGNRMVRHVAADMRRLAREGFNTVIHTFNENDMKFNHLTMKEIVEVSHEAGHEVYIDPWGVGQVFGGESFSLFAQLHPLDGCQRISDGKPGACACPNHPAFRDFMKQWIEAAAWTGADIAFWDEPHFYLSNWMIGRPDTWGCLCEYCRAAYEKKFGERMPKIETAQVKEFKSECLVEFLRFLLKTAHKAGLRNALCVLPYDEPEVARKKWLRFARLPHLEVFGTDPYWCFPNSKKTVEMVGDYSRLVQEVCEKTGREAQVWIQAFLIPEGREPEVGRAIDLAAGAGVKNLAVWGVDACLTLSYIRPANPAKVWREVTRGFRRVARRG